jgi:ABC-2 type transport system ATP-binding protein
MRRNHFEIDLEGDQKAIAKATTAVRNIAEFKLVTLRHRRLELFLQEEAVAATALAAVFTALNENKVTLVGVRSVGQQTEQAFLDLVNKEESRGFARIYNGEAA